MKTDEVVEMKKKDIKIRMKLSHPGAFIKTEVLDELGLSVTRSAKFLGVSRATLPELFNDKAALSPEMGLRLEKALHLNMDMLLRIQAWYGVTGMRN